MAPLKQVDHYTVRCAELGLSREMQIVSLVQLMQESSMRHVLKLNSSAWDLATDNLTWVLLRKEVHIERFPELQEELRIVTYPSGFERVLAYRDFKVFDKNDQLIATAASTWTLMNTIERKIVRIPQRFYDMNTPEDEKILERANVRIHEAEQFSENSEYKVKYSDLDWNGHVNNISLIRLMMDNLPFDHYNSKKLKSILIHIKAESLFGDNLIIKQSINENCIVHQIHRFDKIIAMAESYWI